VPGTIRASFLRDSKLGGMKFKRQHYLFLTFVYLYVPFLCGTFNHPQRTADLSAFYWAADTAYHARSSPYDPKIVAAAQHGPRVKRWPQTPFLYPPPALLLFFPLSLASYHAVQIAFLILNHAGLLLLIYLLMDGSIFSLVYVLCFQPIAATLQLGQINLVVCVFMVLTWISLKQKRKPVLVALPLVASTLLKTYPVVLASLLVIRKQYKALAWYCGFLVFGCVLSQLVLPPSSWSDWWTFVLPTGAYGNTPIGLPSVASPWNQGINAFTSRLFIPNLFSTALFPNAVASQIIPDFLSALILIITVIAIMKSNHSIDLQFSAMLLAVFLIAPLAWEAAMVLILPAIVVALKQRQTETLPAKIAIFTCAFGIAWPVPFYAQTLRSGIQMLLISVKFYCVFFFWIFFILKMKRGGKRKAATQIAARSDLFQTRSLINDLAPDHR
jgi:Glycosyltransferase family 87